MIASANEGRVQSAYEWPANGKGGACVLLWRRQHGAQKSSVHLIESEMHSYETHRKKVAKLAASWKTWALLEQAIHGIHAETNRRAVIFWTFLEAYIVLWDNNHILDGTLSSISQTAMRESSNTTQWTQNNS
jgi:hypothetical protein